uniref:cysteine-rich secretory protein 2-like n=1 Tax=Semicossyphus pulcher TaxID=241346 RepID=UPI0037E7B488
MLKMEWHSEAAAKAKEWAEKCSMLHSTYNQRKISTSGCGENLYMSSHKQTWTHAVNAWYAEVKNWNYTIGSTNGLAVGHFTQVIWYRSNYIGCGFAVCPNSEYKYHYVCHYCPPGNYLDEQPYNTGAPCASCPNHCKDNLCTNPCDHYDWYSNCQRIVAMFGCKYFVPRVCGATCNCRDKIV